MFNKNTIWNIPNLPSSFFPVKYDLNQRKNKYTRICCIYSCHVSSDGTIEADMIIIFIFFVVCTYLSPYSGLFNYLSKTVWDRKSISTSYISMTWLGKQVNTDCIASSQFTLTILKTVIYTTCDHLQPSNVSHRKLHYKLLKQVFLNHLKIYVVPSSASWTTDIQYSLIRISMDYWETWWKYSPAHQWVETTDTCKLLVGISTVKTSHCVSEQIFTLYETW